MAITAKQIQTGIAGSYGGIKNDNETVEYQVYTDSKTQTRYDIMLAGVLPTLFQSHPDNPILTVRDIELSQDIADTVWTAVISYSSEPFDKEDEEEEDVDNPTDRAARVRWTTTQFTKPIYKDINGDPIVNSATDYFDPPVEIDASRFSIVIEKNLSAVPSWVLNYANTINESPFNIQGLTIPAKTAKLSELAISELQREQTAGGTVDFYSLTFRLELATADEGDWTLRVLDQGLHQFDRAENKTPILIDGEPAKQPVLLDGNGLAITDPEPTDAVFLEFDGYVEKDFSVLPFT